MTRPAKKKRGTPGRFSPKTAARLSTNIDVQSVVPASKEPPEDGTPKLSETSAPTSRLDATDDDAVIDDVTEEELRQGITGYSIIGFPGPRPEKRKE